MRRISLLIEEVQYIWLVKSDIILAMTLASQKTRSNYSKMLLPDVRSFIYEVIKISILSSKTYATAVWFLEPFVIKFK